MAHRTGLRPRRSRIRAVVAATAGGVLVLSACGDPARPAGTAPAGTAPTAPAAKPASTAPSTRPAASPTSPPASSVPAATNSSSRNRPPLPDGTRVRVAVTGTVTTGLTSPWGLAFLPDGSALVTERDTARVRQISARAPYRVSTVGTVAGVEPSGEGGLLGIAVDPRFPTRPYIYVYASTSADNRIIRYNFRGGQISQPKPILTGLDVASNHDGGRMVFGPDGLLYVGVGDASERDHAPDRSSLNGKILRITADGAPAPGNPFSSRVYSYGHRNVQGLAFGPDRTLYASEFGQNDFDEINTITAGANYGWPAAEGIAKIAGLVDPIAVWKPDEASPSGLAHADGNLFMAGLRGKRLWVIPVAAGRRVGEPQAYLTDNYGRLRTIEPAPDGSLWLITSNTDGRASPRPGDDRILRLTVQRA